MYLILKRDLIHLYLDKYKTRILGWREYKIERAMALRAATGGQQATPTAAGECLTTCDGKVARQNAVSDEQRLPGSNEAVPQSKTSVAEKWELTGITIPVKKPKTPMKWNCTVCEVQATSEQNLQQHYAGQKHLLNVATLDQRATASGQKATTAAEPSLGTEQKKTSSIKWSCNTCQATGSGQSGLEAHLKGKRHRQNISATSMPKNVAAGEAKSHAINVPKRSEKPPSAWSCSICQAICTSESDLNSHLRGIRHQAKVQSLLEGKSMARKEKLNPDSRWACRICQAQCTCESDLENHLAGKRHQLNIQVLSAKTKEEKNNAPQMAKNQKPPSEWNCTMCEAECNSKSQFEDHCRSSRHQQKIEEVLGKGKTVKASSRKAANELLSDCSNRKNANSEKLEKRQIVYFCEQCNSGTMLIQHRAGKKHREKLDEKK
uniref:C2H2-type domain-containing protein n=1 Tax=Aegilops tauschii subsp. strangulata TaxID=200361 RepID=A0A453KWM5_AEGTS